MLWCLLLLALAARGDAWLFSCGSSDFHCNNGNCIPASWECDGEADCTDGSDEASCGGGGTCQQGVHFFCANGQYCIDSNWVCDGDNDCGDMSDEQNCGGGGTTDPTAPVVPFTGDCGSPAITPQNVRVVGGVQAVQGSWPWQASLKLYGSHVCGGQIIAPNWIVTAAHCVDGQSNPSSWRVSLGSHRRTSTDSTQQDFNVVRVIMHENYDSNQINNDVALMKLSGNAEFNNYVSPICLPSTDVAADTPCVTTGWGDTGSGASTYLMQATVPIMEWNKCNGRQYMNGAITDKMICAGYDQGGKDACQGDSGGPLVCNYSGKWTLDGIVSWGYGCAQAYKPGIYTRVTQFTSWINNKMATN
ncbi:trypsin-3-like [Branchiostoma lanceolatum]|uniref:trypsin-3-like n=1 Tax=Branchiostoma lanceolatum TaxID=7740 RepID=UPI003456FCBC